MVFTQVQGERLRPAKMVGVRDERGVLSTGRPGHPGAAWDWDPEWQGNGKLESVACVLRSLAVEGRRARRWCEGVG